MDISKNNLYIDKIIKVIKSKNTHSRKLLHVNDRHSDAFVYIISGSCTYTFDDGYSFTVKSGDILYLAYRSVYTMYIHTNDYMFIFCDFEFEENSVRNSSVYSSKNTENALALFNKLFYYYNSAEVNSFSKCMSLLYDVYSIIKLTSDRMYIFKSAQSKIALAKNKIDSDYNNPSLSVQALAEYAGMSEVYFRKLFKSQYDISPSEYITLIRLKNAKELMRYPFLSLKECALQSGFTTQQYFARVFKKKEGMSPSKYANTIKRL